VDAGAGARVRPTVGIVGGGQLARMLAPPAVGLGIHLRVLAADRDEGADGVVPVVRGDTDDLATVLAFAEGCDVITFDHERVPAEVVRGLEDAGVVVGGGGGARGRAPPPPPPPPPRPPPPPAPPPRAAECTGIGLHTATHRADVSLKTHSACNKRRARTGRFVCTARLEHRFLSFNSSHTHTHTHLSRTARHMNA
jgi:hypothetical protein